MSKKNMEKVFHYIFRTYKKKQVLDGWVAEEMESIVKDICKEKGFELICQSILVDHVHLLIRKKATNRNEYVMKMIKGISSRRFFKKYPSNRFEFRKLWGRSYRAEEIKDKEHLGRVIRYIQWQKINGLDKRIRIGNRDVQSQVSVLRRGVTLTELMIVVALIGILFVAVQPYFFTLRKTWQLSDGRSDMLQNARIGLDKMVRELRQATAFTSVTASTEAAGSIVFINKDGNSVEFKRYNDGTNNMLGYVQGGVTSPLAGPIDSLKFTCYQEDALTQTTTAGAIKVVDIALTVADPRGQISPITLPARAFLRQDEIEAFIRVVNEVMYNPLDSIPGNEDSFYEYIEFYNASLNPVDFAGWQLTDGGTVDDIIGDAVHGSGTTIVPAGGYVLITDGDTKVYDGLVYTVNPAAVRLRVDDNDLVNGLQNNQDTVIIWDSTGAAVDSLGYSDTWGAGGSDGLGDSLERINPSGPTNDPTNWEDSVLNGTPGWPN